MGDYIEQHKFIDNVLPCYGHAVLINEKISLTSFVLWLISTKRGLYVIVNKDGIDILQKATESMIVICYNILVRNYKTINNVLDKAIMMNFPENDNLEKHFTFDVIAKPSYVLTATSDVFDKCLCVVDADSLDKRTTKQLIQRKLFAYCNNILDVDLDTISKIDWKIECDKLCEYPANYVFTLGNGVSFTLMFADNYEIVNNS